LVTLSRLFGPEAEHKIHLLAGPGVQLGGNGLEGLWVRRDKALAL